MDKEIEAEPSRLPLELSLCQNDPFDLTRSISFLIDDSTSSLLSSRICKNTEEELSIPREIITKAVHSTRFQAELQRPIRIGIYNSQPAFLLVFHFSFQRISDRSFARVQAATIDVEFLNAPRDDKDGRGSREPGAKNPSIAKFYPVLYEGPTSQGKRTYHADASANIAPPTGGPSIGAGISRETTVPVESKLCIHGVSSGRNGRNLISWTVSEDRILKNGIPREMCFPILITMKKACRFSAKVTVGAHGVVHRGLLSKMVPVAGKMDDPLFFDPQTLADFMDAGERGSNGTLIALDAGSFDEMKLDEYSSFAGQ